MTDKSKELIASISLLNDKLNFRGMVVGNEPVSIDYTPPLGDNLGYTSLELLLLSLSSCVGSAVLTKNIVRFGLCLRGMQAQKNIINRNSIIIAGRLTMPQCYLDQFVNGNT